MCSKDGKFDQGRYHTIPETSNIKLPIGGKIRLGVKVVNDNGAEYPKELPYFVCPPEVKKVFGDEPTELTVFFPSNKREEVFPQAYEKYGSNNALLCIGDGEVSKTAQRLNLENGRWEDRKCPCEHFQPYDKKTKIGGCSKAGHLKFMIPSVSIGTFYECTTHGTVSISELNSAFGVADVTTGGRWAMIPFRMKRVAKKLKIPGSAKMKTHWVITLEVAASTEEIRRVMAGEILYLGQLRGDKKYQLEAPELPEANKEIVVVKTDEEIKEVEEKEKAEAIDTAKREKTAEELKAKLAADQAAGVSGINKDWREINKKLDKEKAALKIDIEKVAKHSGINSWKILIELGRDKNIFPETVFSWHTAMAFLCNNPVECKVFIEEIEGYISEDDIPF